eukprot:m.24535 g.24535  ORF g.24535 m.24535 type:complete len:141 (-) comp13397_c0_seq1:30-452(-)
MTTPKEPTTASSSVAQPVEVTSSNKNGLDIICSRCNSKILLKNVAELHQNEYSLPKMYQKGSEAPVEQETISSFWVVGDMFAFENVGFSHAVGDVKYLTCAECEIGPIGYHIPSATPKQYLIATERIRYRQEPQEEQGPS